MVSELFTGVPSIRPSNAFYDASHKEKYGQQSDGIITHINYRQLLEEPFSFVGNGNFTAAFSPSAFQRKPTFA
jgi:hypothetical protein